ncbi:MAG TPA: sterol desaturase family protein [Woeseiaceae bacterium]|nr:sterol desaturase family protein [Woeseiaceae bacterium]
MSGSWLINHEAEARLVVFLGVLTLMIAAQQLWPRRSVPGGWRRQIGNLSLVLISTVLLRFGFPVLAVEAAIRVEQQSIGLLRDLPVVLNILLGMLALDLLIYWQHRILHLLPFLWRLHRVHHADIAIDVSTGVRFHPFEIALSMLIKLAVIALLGILPLAVLLFEILLNAGSLFTHANLRLPAAMDRRLRWLIVTPDMHRIHHSWHREETDSNFGFHLSIWDRVFRSYREAPRDGQEKMTIGLHEFRDPKQQTVTALLLNPFNQQRKGNLPE